MKLSVSLSEEDVATLDRYVERAGLQSRSAGVQHAVRRLGDEQLESAYEHAFTRWSDTGDGDVWASVTGDRLDRAQG